ncbi:hypothetical protein CLAIMM_11216 [Cladophialophora immunda]|nr:hypothetical protein CLAIMM_11216 [Cladophialophora immunda]
MADFEQDFQSLEFAEHPLKGSFAPYQIQMSRLCLILRQVVATRTGETNFLQNYSGTAPSNLQIRHPPQRAALRPGTTDLLDNGASFSTISAAEKIISLIYKIIRRRAQFLMPHEAFSRLFLAEMVWLNASEAWDSAPWVLKLFDNLMANMKSEGQTRKTQQGAPDMPRTGASTPIEGPVFEQANVKAEVTIHLHLIIQTAASTHPKLSE